MSGTKGAHIRSERGAAAVELALVLFPLLLILLGIVEFGRVYSMQLSLQHTARELAREIALKYDDPDVDDLTAIIDGTLEGLGLLNSDITECSTEEPVENAIVYLEQSVDLAIPLPETLDSVPVTANAVMACEG